MNLLSVLFWYKIAWSRSPCDLFSSDHLAIAKKRSPIISPIVRSPIARSPICYALEFLHGFCHPLWPLFIAWPEPVLKHHLAAEFQSLLYTISELRVEGFMVISLIINLGSGFKLDPPTWPLLTTCMKQMRRIIAFQLSKLSLAKNFCCLASTLPTTLTPQGGAL